MKICLTTPPSDFLMDQKVFCSLGILKVGASLLANGYQVDHLDLSGVSNYLETVSAYLQTAGSSGTFALTATTPQMPAAVKIAELVRANGRKTILGGPHATLVNAARRRSGSSDRCQRAFEILCKAFDVLVAGDGEQAIFQALEMKSGLVDADNPNSPLWLTSKKFTDAGWPARQLIDMDSYHYHIDGERSLSCISQLGCPMQCTFCSGRNSPMLRRIRLRPPEDVIAEMVHLYDTYGTKGCMFLDDELNINKQMLPLMRGLAKAAEDRGIRWSLRGFLKAELFTDEQAAAMYEAGFRQLLIGFEAGHPRILENIQKQATVEENTRAMEIATRHGLKVKALMSIGHPGESEETIMALRDWLLKVEPSDFDVTVITPYPGSPYDDEAVDIGEGVWCYTAAKSGDRLYMRESDFTKEAHFYKGSPGSYISYVWTDYLSQDQLVTLRDQVEKDVRERLGIPFYKTGTVTQYEHSMGQSRLPESILVQA